MTLPGEVYTSNEDLRENDDFAEIRSMCISSSLCGETDVAITNGEIYETLFAVKRYQPTLITCTTTVTFIRTLSASGQDSCFTCDIKDLLLGIEKRTVKFWLYI